MAETSMVASDSGAASGLNQELVKLFIGILLVGAIVIGGSAFWFHRVEVAGRVAALEERERVLVALGEEMIASHLRQVASDLRLMARQAAENNRLLPGPDRLPALVAQYVALGDTRGDYAALGLLDAQGRPLVWVQPASSEVSGYSGYQALGADETGSAVVDLGETTLSGLAAGEALLFLTEKPPRGEPLDRVAGSARLNLLLAVPAEASDQPREYILVRDDPHALLTRLSALGRLNDASLMILDGEGEFVWAAGGPEAEQSDSDAKTHPLLDVWSDVLQLARQGVGQFSGPSGLVTFQWLNLDLLLPEGRQLDQNAGWILVSQVSADAMTLVRRGPSGRLWLFAAMILGLMVIGAWFLAAAWAHWHAEQRRNQHLAHFDTVTELPNRALFFDRLERIHVHSQRYRQRYGLIYLDLDGFKEVNDHYGHADGDKLLKLIGRMLVNSLRNSDTVARVGGDEFVVLLSMVSDADAAMMLGNKIVAAVAAPIRLERGEAEVRASVGVALFPDHGNSSEQVLRAADDAMYRAKREGGGRCFLAEAPPAA